MINPSEYRLGNIIRWNPALKDSAITLPALNIEIAAIEAAQVGYISLNIEHRSEAFEDELISKDVLYRNLQELEPITLTPALIEKAGFTNARLSVNNESGMCTFAYASGSITYTEDGRDFHFNCKYLHQLQNMYYALKGMELDTTGITAMG